MKKNDIFVITIFFIVSIFISLLFNTIESAYKISLENNSLRSKDAFNIEINTKDVSNKDFIDIIKNIDGIYLETNNINLGIYYGNLLYSTSKNHSSPPLLEGTFFTDQNLKLEKNLCVIGKVLIDMVKIIDGVKFISINGIDYEVIGIMGRTDKITAFDNTFYINLNSDTQFNINSKWIIDGEHLPDNYLKLKDDILNIDSNSTVIKSDVESQSSSITKIVYSRMYIIILVSIVIITLLLNIANATNNYIINRKKEFGIRRTFGATKKDIYKKILTDYQLMSIKAFIISQIFYLIIIKFKTYSYVFGESLMLRSSICTFLLLLVLGSLFAILPIIKSNKFEPNEVMKGI